MRPHLSVLMLVARSTIYKIIGLLLVLALVDGVLFYFAMGSEPSGLEDAFTQSRINIAFGVCFPIITILLDRTGYASGGKQEYTLRRLSISERSIFVWHAFYNTSCYIMLWAAQLFMALALCRLYLLRIDPTLTSGQTVFLAFYRNSFLHSHLPLGEVSRWVSNVAMIIGYGVTAAEIPFGERRGKSGVSAFMRAWLALTLFNRGLGNYVSDVFLSMFGLAITGVAIYRVWRDGREAEGEHED